MKVVVAPGATGATGPSTPVITGASLTGEMVSVMVAALDQAVPSLTRNENESLPFQWTADCVYVK